MPENKQTLIVLTPGFPASEADSTCLPLQQGLVKTLAAQYPYIEVVVLSFQYPYHAKNYDWHGVRVYSFNGRNRGGLRRLLLRKRVYNVLKKIQNQQHIIGIMSCWYGECALVGHRMAASTGVPHYCWILGQDARKANPYPQRVKAPANELLALSDFLQDEFEKNHGIRPAQVLPPGIDTSLFDQKQQVRDIDILGVGSLIPLKRFDLWIETIAALRQTIPGIRAVLVGDGPAMNDLKKTVAANDLSDHISFTGELPYGNVLQLMQRTKILLHLSSYEGYSGVCQEALYAGAHAVSFCRAMQMNIPQWHIVKTKEEMEGTVLQLLQHPNNVYEPVVTNTMAMLADSLMRLFIRR